MMNYLACETCPVSTTIRRCGVFFKQLSGWFYSRSGFAPLTLRLLLAYEFLEAGLEKLSGENWFAELVFPFPFNLLPHEVNFGLSMGVEIIAPIALIFGIATRFFSFALIVLTVVAIITVHLPAEWHSLTELWKGYAITNQGYGNYKLPLMYLLMLISLLFSGSGHLSVDAWRSRK